MTEYIDAVGNKIEVGDIIVLAESRQVPLLVGEVVGFKEGRPSKVMITYKSNFEWGGKFQVKERNINPKGLAVVKSSGEINESNTSKNI